MGDHPVVKAANQPRDTILRVGQVAFGRLVTYKRQVVAAERHFR